MSEFAQLPSAAPAPRGPDHLTAGMLLRQAREAAGFHPEALAGILKVPVQKVEALEADRFDLLPDMVFVRAMASSVCRTLDVDAQPVLERLPGRAMPRLAQSRDRVNAPFRGPNDAIGPGWRDRLVRPPVLAMLALLFGALVLVLLPQSWLDQAIVLARAGLSDAPQPVTVDEPVTPPAATLVGPPTTAAAVAPPAAVSTLIELPPAPPPGPSPAVAEAQTAAPAQAAPPASAPAPAPAPAPTGPSAAPPPGTGARSPAASLAEAPAGAGTPGLLVFRAKGASWVEVRDAQGVVALRRLLGAGETADVSGTPPLSVTVGKVSAIEVQVRGQAFDLAAVSRDNVARFQVR